MTIQESTRTLVGAHVGRVVTGLQARYLPSGSRARPDSSAAAALARLRRAPVDDLTEGSVFDIVYDRLPERLMSDAGVPTGAESAIHAALVLYAGHQQSRGEAMHVSGRSLGRAARELAMLRGDGVLDEAAVTRFQRVATATGRSARLVQLRSFIALLRSHPPPHLRFLKGRRSCSSTSMSCRPFLRRISTATTPARLSPPSTGVCGVPG